MTVELGYIVDYAGFRKLCEEVRVPPLLWRGSELMEAVAGRKESAERGLVALSRSADLEGGNLHAGLTVAIQVIGPGRETVPHAHTWWHLFVVLSGRGECTFDEGAVWQALELHDVLLIPAGHRHRFRGTPEEGLVLINVSNIAEQACTGNFVQS